MLTAWPLGSEADSRHLTTDHGLNHGARRQIVTEPPPWRYRATTHTTKGRQ
jgi:hypothetical protein